MTAQGTLLLVRIVLAYAVGLFAPGYLAARLLRSRAAVALALPLSMLLMLLGVQALDAAGVPIRFGTVLGWELAVLAALGCAAYLGRRSAEPPPAARPCAGDGAAWPWLLAGGVGLVIALAALRGFLVPLAGWDVAWRWEFLARQMGRLETLAFYPPVTVEDLRAYCYPDAFAPIVSIPIWWIYAAAGRALEAAAAPLALGQYLSVLALVYQVAERLHSRRAGVYATAVLAATPLFLRSVLAGQETGLTALSVAGAVHALVHAEGPRDARAGALAGLMVACGALAREYGLALAACALAVAAWKRLGWRTLAPLAAAFALAAGPWFVRTVLRSGNPFLSHGLGVFPVNPVLSALLGHYSTIFGIGALSPDDWVGLAERLLVDAPWALVGVAAGIRLARRLGYLLAGAAVGAALWLASIGYANGGLLYSTRILTPAAALLAVAGAIGLAEWAAGPGRRRFASAVLTASLASAAAWTAAYPFAPAARDLFSTRPALLSELPARLEPDPGVSALEALLPSGSKVLGDSPYLHAALVRARSSLELVPFWRPDVAFLFDPALTTEQRGQQLAALGIGAVLLDQNSVNLPFLQTASPFFGGDVARWKPVGAISQHVLVAVPPAVPP